MNLTQKEVMKMIKIDDYIKKAKEILSEESESCIDTKSLTIGESNRIFKDYIKNLFSNTILTEYPVLIYSYPIDRRANIVEARSLIENQIIDYFSGNFYAIPAIKFSENSVIVINSMATNNFISIMDKQLVRELSDFLSANKKQLKEKETVSFSYLEKLKNQMPAYVSTRKTMIMNQLKELGYNTDSTSQFSIAINIG